MSWKEWIHQIYWNEYIAWRRRLAPLWHTKMRQKNDQLSPSMTQILGTSKLYIYDNLFEMHWLLKKGMHIVIFPSGWLILLTPREASRCLGDRRRHLNRVQGGWRSTQGPAFCIQDQSYSMDTHHSQIYSTQAKRLNTRFHDPASWLPLAAEGESSRNLVFTF